jgi:regulator of sigma E protease
MNALGAIGDIFSTLGGFVIAILALLLMVTIHEFGHYLAGRKLGFKINEFAVGFGPKLLSKKRKDGTVVSLRAFPLGGFCAFEGEDEDNPNSAAFNNQKPYKRVIVLAAGAIFNLLSGIIFSFIVLLAVGNMYKIEALRVAEVYDTGTAGLSAAVPNPNNIDGKIMAGDIILSVAYESGESRTIVTSADLSSALAAVPEGQTFSVTVNRDGNVVTNTGLAKWAYTQQQEVRGVNCSGRTRTESVTVNGIGAVMQSEYKDDYNVLEAARDCVPYAVKMGGIILSSLGRLITGATGMRDVGGTVTTISVMAQAASANIANILILLPLFSVNLGLFNLLPIPALDGSRIIFTLIEWIRGKPVSRKIEGWVHAVGFLFLIGFVVLADILQFFVF